MLSRRHFLVSGCQTAASAWFIGGEVLRAILHLAEEGEPYLVDVEKPACELWATYCGEEYVFSLGRSLTDIIEPRLTWRQWLEMKDVNITKPDDIRDFLYDWGWFHPDDEPYAAPDLNADLPDQLRQNYLDWEFTMNDAPTARAYFYLQGLELANRRTNGEGLGCLDFVEGPCPGNNARLVSTHSVALIGGLQQRLLELGQRVRIHTDCCG